MPALTPGDALPQPDKVGHERHGEFVTALVAERSRGPGRGERAVGRRSPRRPDIGTMTEAIARTVYVEGRTYIGTHRARIFGAGAFVACEALSERRRHHTEAAATRIAP